MRMKESIRKITKRGRMMKISKTSIIIIIRRKRVHAEAFFHHHSIIINVIIGRRRRNIKLNTKETNACTSQGRASPWVMADVTTMWTLSHHISFSIPNKKKKKLRSSREIWVKKRERVEGILFGVTNKYYILLYINNQNDHDDDEVGFLSNWTHNNKTSLDGHSLFVLWIFLLPYIFIYFYFLS